MFKNLIVLLLMSTCCGSYAQFLEKKEDLRSFEGFFNFHYSPGEDKIFLEVRDTETEFLYTHFLTSGLGSNDVGLDRGQLGGGVIVKFVRAGNKLLLVQPNQKYRAVTSNLAEKQSVEQAFARSVLFGFEIKEEKKGTFIIDLTPFLMEDAHGVAPRLKKGDYGTYKLDKNKSALATARTKAFPDNVEFEALLTFKGEAKGNTLREVIPDPGNITTIQHHSFVRLPDDKYSPRQFDPRSGAISISYMDYASPVHEPIIKRKAIRHRLEKKDPSSGWSEPKEPIIYYLDPGTPEPVRSALLEGASWWNEAFEAIGYKNAFQVKMLPEDADPLDVRYNVIQWVHRATRGWSYGASVVDPRTGEIIKGHVSLGSLRIRQDFMIAQALLNQPFARSDQDHDPMLDMALARIRQLAAHEVGHTLGFAHNFAASAAGQASVMDYPHPRFALTDGEIDLRDAYATGMGDWDKITVAYSYGDIPEGTPERAHLSQVLEEAQARGLQFISDADARARGGAHVRAHLWDNGTTAVEELDRILGIRARAIDNFSVDNIRTDEPYSVLEDVFVPLYFFHRYQSEAAVKLIGGLDYNYAVKGGNQAVWETLDPDLQRKALQGILHTLDATTLAIPEEKLQLFPPRAFGYPRTRESFKSNTGVAFDVLGAPVTAASMNLSLLLDPQRAARLVQQKALDQKQVGLEEVLSQLLEHTVKTKKKAAYLDQVQQAINYQVFQQMLALSVDPRATPQVRAVVLDQVYQLRGWLSGQKTPIHRQMLRDIQTFEEEPGKFKIPNTTPKLPDGSPIGSFGCYLQ